MNLRPRFPMRRPVASLLASLALLAIAPVAAAQPPPPDSVTVLARQRYNDGVKAYDAGRYEDARQAFLQAYALKHHPAVLLNLGQSELRSGHFDDAGNHLSQFVREWASATADERATAQKGLDEARKKSGLITVSVDAAGADVSVDGVTVGKSPLPAPIFVKPGMHAVYASQEGRSGAASIDVKAGGEAAAALKIGVAPPPPAPVPTPTPEPVAPPPPAGESFGSWYSHKPIAWVGTGLAGLGLLGGIIFGASALSASSSSTSDASAITADAAKHGAPSDVCNPSVLSSPMWNSRYAQPCSVLSTDISHYHTDVGLEVTSWVLFGVGVAGTALYAYLDWTPRRSAQSASASASSHTIVVPVVTPAMQGVVVSGSF